MMNCDTCGVTFMKWNDLRQHATLENHTNQTTHTFSCAPCALPLQTIPDVIQHIDSEEHYILSLASDNPFDKPTESSDGLGESFPPLYFCMLCSCRDGNPYGIHLKSIVHKNIARLMRAIYSEQTIHYTNDGRDEDLFVRLKDPAGPVYCELCNSWSSNWHNYKVHLKNTVHMRTQEFMNKLINVKSCLEDIHSCEDICYSFPFTCELCNLHFNSHEYYKHHLEDQTHKRVELFLTKISDMVRRMDVVIRCADLKITETFSNSLPPLYYCPLCDLFCFKALGYLQHSKGINHRRIEELFDKLSDKRKGNVIRLDLGARGFKKLSAQNYCKLCLLGFQDAQSYNSHLKDKGHLRIEHFVKYQTNAGDANFMNIYIDAQSAMMFGTIPPNYCKVCNILHSKSDKYERHLESEEHKQAEQSYIENKRAVENENGGNNSSKKLKISPPSPQKKALDDIQCLGTKIGNGVHQKKEPPKSNVAVSRVARNNICSRRPQFGRHTKNSRPPPWLETETCPTNCRPQPWIGHETVNSCPAPWIGLKTCSTGNHPPPWLRFESNTSNNQPPPPWIGYQYNAFYGNPPPWSEFVAKEPCDYPPPWSGFVAREPSDFPPPWTGFVAREQCDYPPWSGFVAREQNDYPPWSGFVAREQCDFPPPWTGFVAREPNDYPPGFHSEATNGNCPWAKFGADSKNSSNPPQPDFPIRGDANDIHIPEPGFVITGNNDAQRPGSVGICPPGTEVLQPAVQHEFAKNSSQPVLDAPVTHDGGFLPDEHCCEVCDFVCHNSRLYDKHLKSEKHKKLRKLLNRKGNKVCLQKPPCETSGHHPMQYNCELCDVFNRNYQEYKFHLESTKHKRNQWLLYVLMQRPL